MVRKSRTNFCVKYSFLNQHKGAAKFAYSCSCWKSAWWHTLFLCSFSFIKSKLRLCILDWAYSYCWWGVIIWLLQAFLECQPHHKHSSHGMSQRSAHLLALQSFQCALVVGCRHSFFSGDSKVFWINFIRQSWTVCTKMKIMLQTIWYHYQILMVCIYRIWFLQNKLQMDGW
jgi:hypothetical protein